MSAKEILPVIGYNIATTEFDRDKLKDTIEVHGRKVVAQRMTIVVPDLHSGEMQRIEVVAPTAWCYRQVKESYTARQALAHEEAQRTHKKMAPPETVGAILDEEVTGDGEHDDEGGNVVRRSHGRASSADPGEQ